MTFAQWARRACALASFAAPTLLLIGFGTIAMQHGSVLIGPALMNDTRGQLAYHFLGFWAHLLMIPALFGMACCIGRMAPRLAVVCAAIALFGLGTVIAEHRQGMNVAVAVRGGFPMNWDFFINGDSANNRGFGSPLNTTELVPGVCQRNGKIVRCGELGPSIEQLATGLPILLYFVANVLLGTAILRTGALPRFSGGLLIVSGLMQFESTGPQPLGMPLLTGMLAAVCLLVVYLVSGMRLWRVRAEPIMHPPNTMA